MSCCSQKPPQPKSPSCCGTQRSRIDWILWGGLLIIAASYSAHFFFCDSLSPSLFTFTHAVFELMNQMWIGLILGIIALAFIGRVPRELVQITLGKGGTLNGILRACGAGLFLDLCNHGILMVAAKLYERGASLGQVFAFLIASPWNSLSLTIILWSLVGGFWTLTFILGSALIAIITGLATDYLIRHSQLPSNPNTLELDPDISLKSEIKRHWKNATFDRTFFITSLKSGILESRMIVRWLFLGTIIAASIRAFIPMANYETWFGPTIVGLFLTLVGATIIEVCSEGSLPIATDLLNRADAPGNAFTFLMAGASTDYTELMILRQTTRSLKLTFLLPLVTLPQIILISYFLNQV